MNTYVSTFVSGLQGVIELALKKYIDKVDVDNIFNGAVVYRTDKPVEEIKKIPFFNNTFLSLHVFNENHSILDLIKKFQEEENLIVLSGNQILNKKMSFRIIASNENQIIQINKNSLQKMENIVEEKTKMIVNRALPDIEFWLVSRKEKLSFIGLRITKTNSTKNLNKGQLRPEIAYVMCFLADLKPNDVVLDPFAGYGSIPNECLKNFQVKEIIAGDINNELLISFKGKYKIYNWDFLNTNLLNVESIDKIMTDPPWGIFDKNVNIDDFYKKMLDQFYKVIKPNGLIILLLGRNDIFENLIKDSDGFKILDRFDILVSGKKSSIYKIKRTS